MSKRPLTPEDRSRLEEHRRELGRDRDHRERQRRAETPRAHTLAANRFRQRDLVQLRLENDREEAENPPPPRPRTRGECEPCRYCQELFDAYRNEIQRSDCTERGEQDGREADRSGAVRLREGNHDKRKQTRDSGVLRLQEESRPQFGPPVQGVDADDPALHEPALPAVRGLRGTRNLGVRAVAPELRGLPGGHGAKATGHDDRQDQRGRGLRAVQLPVDHSRGTVAEHHAECDRKCGRTSCATEAGGRDDRDSVRYAQVEAETWLGPCARGHRNYEVFAHSRPCLFPSCRHHLFSDVSPTTGSLKLNHPHIDLAEMMESCSLDTADSGPSTLEEVAVLLNVSRERVRQLEVAGLAGALRAASLLTGWEDPC